MKNKKYQVFVSSTFTDLIEERQAAVETILSSGNIPAGMELFSAGDDSQLSVIKRWIDESDIFLLIVGGRYGSIEPKSGKSYIQLEYEYAVEKGIPYFAIVITKEALNNKVKDKGVDIIERNEQKLFEEFKKTVESNMVKFWDDKKDIKIAIQETLSDFTYSRNKDMTGWIKGDNSLDSNLLAQEIARLTKENSELRTKLNSLQNHKEPLFNNFTFNELKTLLVKTSTHYDGKRINLFQYLLIRGESIAWKIPIPGDQFQCLKELEVYKIILITSSRGRLGTYKFTEDGHNFFLKAKFESLKDRTARENNSVSKE